jgi:hypothetical protein
MTKLDLVIERIRRLPQDEQDIILAEVESLLDQGQPSPLTPAQQVELARRLADANTEYVAHDQVVAHLTQKFGR